MSWSVLGRRAVAAFLFVCGIMLLPWNVAASGVTAKVESFDLEGNIGPDIPVSVWLEVLGDVVCGEIVYTKTGSKPIRLIGKRDAENLRVHEMLSSGDISGTLELIPEAGGKMEGTWTSYGSITKKNGNFFFSEGKSYAVKLVPSTKHHKPFRWKAKKVAGKYAYSYGDLMGKGELDVKLKKKRAYFAVESVTDAPSFNMAEIKSDAAFQDGEFSYIDGVDCHIRFRFFNGFAAVDYVKGKYCEGRFGMRATPTGVFLKVGK